MPARTGNTTFVPGRGATTVKEKVKPSGKVRIKKTFQGEPSAAPAAAKVRPEATAETAPTVTVEPSGKVTTQNFGERDRAGARKARRARRETRQRRQRVRRIVRTIRRQERERETTSAPTPPKPRSPAEPVDFKPTGPTPQIRKQEVADHQTFLAEQKPRKVTRRPNPEQNPGEATISSQPRPPVTPRERKAARAKVRRTRRELNESSQATQLPYLETPEQQQNARTVLRTGKQEGATRKELLAAAETGLVESYGFKNLHEGDADSEGWRQERRMYYDDPTNVKASAQRFFQEAKTDSGPRATAGQLAQTVQGSAFPERYDERKPEAAAILRAFENGKADPKAKARYENAVKEARELGLKVSTKGIGLGKPAPKLVKRMRAGEAAMKEIEGTPYVYGGGHNLGPVDPSGGLDCSSSLSYVLQKMGVKLPGAVVSGEMGNYLEPGPGAFTVYYNAEHTFASYINRKGKTIFWGTSAGDSGAGGLGPHPRPSADYLAQYNVAHVPGMNRKVALQMGATPGSFAGAFNGSGSAAAIPGMTFSDGGTTATIDKGAGTKKTKPGMSNKPIELTVRQEIRQRVRKLRALGNESARMPGEDPKYPAPEAKDPLAVSLAELEKKYGAAV